jgi:hypothetical protein
MRMLSCIGIVVTVFAIQVAVGQPAQAAPLGSADPGHSYLQLKRHVNTHALPRASRKHGLRAAPRLGTPPRGLAHPTGRRPTIVSRSSVGPSGGSVAGVTSPQTSTAGGGSGGSSGDPNTNDGALEQLTGFGGLGETCCIPPDTQVAVGPNSVVEMVNVQGRITTKAGVQTSTFNNSDFFGGPQNAMNSAFWSDPRVLYDTLSGRFFATILIFDSCNPAPPPTGSGCTTNGNSEVDLAVSGSNDPTNWAVYIVQTSTNNVLFDQPKLGASNDKVVLTWNDNGFSGPYQFVVVQKAGLVAQNNSVPAFFFATDSSHFNVIPVISLTPTDIEYAVNADQNSSTLTVTAFTGVPGVSPVSATMTDMSIGDYSTPPGAVQPNSGPTLDTGVPAVQSAVFQSGEIWTGGNDSCTPPGDNTARACLRFDTVDVSGTTPTLTQDFDLGQVGAYLFYPAVMVDTFGNFFVGHSVSSSSEFGTAGMTFAPAGPFPSVLAGIDYRSGSATYSCFLNGINRWGDYSGAARDPSNSKDVWFAAELGSTSSTDSCAWGTQIGRFTQAPPTVTGVSPNSAPELTSACAPAVSLTGTDFVAGQTSVSFGSVAASSVSVTSPESLTAVAPAQARGTVDVTVTTPAGASPANAADQFTYSPDTAPPSISASISPPPNLAGWNTTSPATVNLVATDGFCGSGVNTITYQAFGAEVIPLTSISGATVSIPITVDGVTTVAFVATDNAGNTSAVQTTTVQLDTMPPAIAISSPAATAYLLNQVVNAAYLCTDATSGVATCIGTVANGSPINTSTVGPNSFTVTASDVAGNSSSATVSYMVAYNICLLYNPSKGVKSGSTDPIKLQICDANNANLSSPTITLTLIGVASASSPSTIVQPLSGTFRYDPTLPGYITNVSTKGLAPGSYVLEFTISGSDTTVHMVPFIVT